MAVFISGTTAPVIIGDADFSNNPWEIIIKACQLNTVPETWKIGDQKAMTINGTEYMVDIIGKDHDNYSDGTGKAPLTFHLHDCYGTKYEMNSSATNVGGYDSTEMHTTRLPAILDAMPTAVKNGIRQVNKLASIGGTINTIETIACKLFLLSEIEIFGSIVNSVNGEGKQYAYYTEGNSAVKRFSGSTDVWFLRSPCGDNRTEFCYIRADGTSGKSSATSQRGVSFAFCF